MTWVDIVGLLAVVQLVLFGVMVGWARGKYGVAAPATTGHPIFERYYRVQMNTVESLLVFLPGLWLAARYWSPRYAAILGVVYLLGRTLYYFSYISDPRKRSAGFSLSMGPAILLVVAAVVGAVGAALHG
jgi:uncharacterized membrane protein YecN with MAPEG domain